MRGQIPQVAVRGGVSSSGAYWHLRPGSNPRFCANPERAGAFGISRASTSQSRACSVESQASPQPTHGSGPGVREAGEAARWEHFLSFLPPARSWNFILNAENLIRCDLSIFRTARRSSFLKVALAGTLLKCSWGQQRVFTFLWDLLLQTVGVQATSAIKLLYLLAWLSKLSLNY